MVMDAVYPAINFVVQIESLLQVVDILSLPLKQLSLGLLWGLGVEQRHSFLISDDLQGSQAVEEAVEDLSKNIVGQGSDSSVVLDVISFEVDLLLACLDDRLLFQAVHLPLDVGSLGLVEVRLLREAGDVEVAVAVD